MATHMTFPRIGLSRHCKDAEVGATAMVLDDFAAVVVTAMAGVDGKGVIVIVGAAPVTKLVTLVDTVVVMATISGDVVEAAAGAMLAPVEEFVTGDRTTAVLVTVFEPSEEIIMLVVPGTDVPPLGLEDITIAAEELGNGSVVVIVVVFGWEGELSTELTLKPSDAGLLIADEEPIIEVVEIALLNGIPTLPDNPKPADIPMLAEIPAFAGEVVFVIVVMKDDEVGLVDKITRLVLLAGVDELGTV
jgi:hypothetical protein